LPVSGTDPRSGERLVSVLTRDVRVEGSLWIPEGATGIVVFAHGSGSGRRSPRNRFVAGELSRRGLATLLIDLLTSEEEAVDMRTAHLRFDIPRLADRLCGATAWVRREAATGHLRVGYFGASTGAAAALVAAADQGTEINAVVSRGGRPDLAGDALERVEAPTLLLVGGDDVPVIELNRQALARLRCEKQLEIVPGATHLFEEPGTLETVARRAGDWFLRYLAPQATAR
jgi:dienelactone hydrolase